MSTVVCPAGHQSTTPDYCHVCGELIEGTAAPPGGAAGVAASAIPSAGTACPDCGTPKTDRFCEACGYDFALMRGGPSSAPPPTRAPEQLPEADPPTIADPSSPVARATPSFPADPSGGTAPGTGWFAVVNADRDYFERVIAELGPDTGLTFPPYCPERRIPLTGAQIRIGRRSSSKSVVPEIDLREPPEDPGVSHVHAVLLARPGGHWSLVDPGSRNRTCLNGATEPIALNVEVPVGDGDRIHVGAWTTITLTRGEPT
ncbi:FHA domain-containing protein [Actinomadura kijaniata]|uniref:FHA domain-containing protein n=1 Tax=Actinomadura kijaniata TaxID=46161 RepID=UPI003F1D52C6